MTFAHPYILLLLLLLPVLAWLKGRHGRPPAFLYSSVDLLHGLTRASRSRAGRWLAHMRWLSLALLIVALARPQLVESEQKVTASGVDIVVALDLSGSMAAEDFRWQGQRVNRLFIAKEVLKEFIEKRPHDRIGLVAFGTDAYVASPPTLDHDFLLANLERLVLHSIDGSRTAIGSSITASLNRLRDLKSKSKIVIVMTDGQNNAGSVPPLTAAEAAHALAVKVYTIGVGTRGTAPFPEGVDWTGRTVYSQREVDIDEETLTAIAQRTGAKYYRADSTDTLKKIYAEIDELEKTEVEVKKYSRVKELFPWPAMAGMLLLLGEFLLGQTVWRRLP